MIDALERRVIIEDLSVGFEPDGPLSGFGLGRDFILPPEEPGDARQPAMLYVAALDAILERVGRTLADVGRAMSEIAVVNFSVQQHGHVLLGERAPILLESLAVADYPPGLRLQDALQGLFSVPFARIWRTTCTRVEAARLRRGAGGKKAAIRLTGSNVPSRFTAPCLMKTAAAFPSAYAFTSRIQLLNTLLSSIMTGSADTELDYGNACGTSLMDYRARMWSRLLIAAAAEGLPGGASALRSKLPALASALSVQGRVCQFVSSRYGLAGSCAVLCGSGDNCQTKVMADGALLSLGSSFVFMAGSDGGIADESGAVSAMYDGLDRPFVIACRTNGALRWDGVREMHGISRRDYAASDEALRRTPCGNAGRIFSWQAEAETLPPSPAAGPCRIGYDTPCFQTDYAGIVESSLAATWLHSGHLMKGVQTLFATGGAASSREVLRRVAAIWNRRVIPVGEAGAALGAAVAGGMVSRRLWRIDFPGDHSFASGLALLGAPVDPVPEDVEAYHGENGFLERFAELCPRAKRRMRP
ncbi:xylulose kinase [Candidatus Fermentibacteria bacterium]|nr:xylulose kinase [Candidatus Fermentibacteria bacterium]